MTYRVSFFGFCEGAIADMRGQITLVGAAPDYIATTIPSTITPSLVLIASEDPPFREFKASLGQAVVSIQDPAGNPVLTMPLPLQLSPKTFKDLPGKVAGILQLPINVSAPGRYTASMRVSVDEEVLVDASCAVHVVDAVDQATQAASGSSQLRPN